MLSKLSPKLKSGQVPEALDELNLFWLRHIDEVQLYLKYWLYGEDCYIFTAATFMDFNDNEHLPFLLMGEKHILDDPLGRYSELCGKMERSTDSEFLYRQVIITSEDNLRILEGTDENILILPLRLFNQSRDSRVLYEIGEQAFVSLFDGIDSIRDYFKKCDSIDDIVAYAREDIGRIVVFSEDDDINSAHKRSLHTSISRITLYGKSSKARCI